MSETPKGTGPASVMDRAQSLLDSLETRIRKAQAKVAETSAKVTAPPVSAGEDDAGQSAPDIRPATERAEETMDRLGSRLGAFSVAVSHQVRKTTALAREGAEDIWAEAQSIRGKKTH